MVPERGHSCPQHERWHLCLINGRSIDKVALEMKTRFLRTANLAVGFLLCLVLSITAHAGDTIKTAGDMLQYALPVFPVVPIITHKDGKGVLQYAESMGLNLALTYTLK